MTASSRWQKNWFVVVMQPSSLILNRYDGNAFSTPTKVTALDQGRKASREKDLDGLKDLKSMVQTKAEAYSLFIDFSVYFNFFFLCIIHEDYIPNLFERSDSCRLTCVLFVFFV
jgi:hypothetical protein